VKASYVTPVASRNFSTLRQLAGGVAFPNFNTKEIGKLFKTWGVGYTGRKPTGDVPLRVACMKHARPDMTDAQIREAIELLGKTLTPAVIEQQTLLHKSEGD